MQEFLLSGSVKKATTIEKFAEDLLVELLIVLNVRVWEPDMLHPQKPLKLLLNLLNGLVLKDNFRVVFLWSRIRLNVDSWTLNAVGSFVLGDGSSLGVFIQYIENINLPLIDLRCICLRCAVSSTCDLWLLRVSFGKLCRLTPLMRLNGDALTPGPTSTSFCSFVDLWCEKTFQFELDVLLLILLLLQL